MRVSRAQAQANREMVIDVASRLFREKGFDGIGLKDLMKGAGLTQGGFYKQFDSKEDLAALASQRAMESATRRWTEAAASSSDPFQAVLQLYLSAGHRGELGDGCPLVALGSDAARQSAGVRQPFEDGVKAHLELLEDLMPASSSGPDTGDDTGKDAGKAMAALSLMVGAVTLSRVLVDEKLSDRLLEVAMTEVKRIAAPDPAG